MPYDVRIPGWMDETDLAVLEALAAAVPAGGSIVEIGCFVGRTTWCLARSAAPDVRVHAVDTFDWLPEPGFAKMAGEAYDATLGAEALFDRYTAGCANVVKHRSRSHPVDTLTGEADLVFIDGSHESPTVDRDIAYWGRRLSPGGVLAGDDFSPHLHPDVCRAVVSYATAVDRPVGFAGGKLWMIRL